MPDARISELPLATTLGDTDIAPLVQASGSSTETRRATLAQLRGAVLADRGAHVRDYGAKGDGSTDDGPAIQAAINDLKAKGGGTLHFGPRIYRIATGVVLNGATVRLQGAGFTEGPGGGQGTWFRINTTGFTPFTFTGVNSRGAGISDIAVQQTHGASQVSGWAPTDYGHVFRVEDCLGGVDFDNVYLCNINRGIYCRNSGRLDIRRLRGQILTTGVEIDECYDIPRIHSLHFWTFWTSNPYVLAWQQANADALLFRRADGVFIDQAFALGYRSMFRFASSAAGVTTKFYIGQAYADFVKYGLWIEASGTDGQVANFTSQNEIFDAAGAPLPGSAAIQVDASNSLVQIGNLRIDAVEDNPIRVNGSGNRLDIFSLRCRRFNTRGTGAAAIHIADSGAAPPNSVYLGSPALLETSNGGPLVNGGTNGLLATGTPAGRAARPGLMLGSTDTGLFLPAAGSLAGAAGGAEVLRATAAGGVTLGAAPGGHALEVATPIGTVNRLLVTGGATGTPVAAQAQGADANVALRLGAKGNGTVALQANGATALEAGATAPAVNWLRVDGGPAGAPVSLSALGTDASIGIAVAPKTNGALMASVPDGTASGGNSRGANAVDWQQVRGSASQVASGEAATIGGGSTNAASAQYATAAGGFSNSVNGVRSWCPGGAFADTRGHYGRGAWGAGGGTGSSQAGEFVLRISAIGAAAVRLTADGGTPGSANTVNLPNNGTYLVRLLVVARQTGGSAGTAGDSAGWIADALVRRGANAVATALIGGGASLAPTYSDSGAVGWRLGIAADASNGGIAISGTGEANKNILWTARVMSVEATG